MSWSECCECELDRVLRVCELEQVLRVCDGFFRSMSVTYDGAVLAVQ